MFLFVIRRAHSIRSSLNDPIISNYIKINQYSSQKAATAVRRKKGKSQSTHVNI